MGRKKLHIKPQRYTKSLGYGEIYRKCAVMHKVSVYILLLRDLYVPQWDMPGKPFFFVVL